MTTHLVRAGFIMSDLDPNMKSPASVDKSEGGYLKDQKFPKPPPVEKKYPTPLDPPPNRGWQPSDWE